MLTDYKKDIECLLPNYFNSITYKSIDELNNKIEYYLTHEYERLEITKEIYEYVVRNHTFTNKAKIMMEKI